MRQESETKRVVKPRGVKPRGVKPESFSVKPSERVSAWNQRVFLIYLEGIIEEIGQEDRSRGSVQSQTLGSVNLSKEFHFCQRNSNLSLTLLLEIDFLEEKDYLCYQYKWGQLVEICWLFNTFSHLFAIFSHLLFAIFSHLFAIFSSFRDLLVRVKQLLSRISWNLSFQLRFQLAIKNFMIKIF